MKKDIFEDWDWEEIDENIIEEYRYSDSYDEYCTPQWWSSGSSGSSVKPKPKHTYSKYTKKTKTLP